MSALRGRAGACRGHATRRSGVLCCGAAPPAAPHLPAAQAQLAPPALPAEPAVPAAGTPPTRRCPTTTCAPSGRTTVRRTAAQQLLWLGQLRALCRRCQLAASSCRRLSTPKLICISHPPPPPLLPDAALLSDGEGDEEGGRRRRRGGGGRMQRQGSGRGPGLPRTAAGLKAAHNVITAFNPTTQVRLGGWGGAAAACVLGGGSPGRRQPRILGLRRVPGCRAPSAHSLPRRPLQALVRRKVRVGSGREEIQQLRVPPPPIPAAWGRTVQPYVPAHLRGQRQMAGAPGLGGAGAAGWAGQQHASKQPSPGMAAPSPLAGQRAHPLVPLPAPPPVPCSPGAAGAAQGHARGRQGRGH